MNRRLLICLIILSLFSLTLAAQNTQLPANIDPVEAQQLLTELQKARAEIKQLGLNEATVKARMKARGVDLDNPAGQDPAKVRTVFREVVQELQAEQQTNQTTNTTANATERVSEAVSEKVGENASEQEVKKVVDEALEDVVKDPTQNIEQRVQEGQTVEEAISEELAVQVTEDLGNTSIYGQQIFREKQLSQPDRSYNVKPPKSYRLGVGDEIAISIFGESVANEKYEIDQNGVIRPALMRPIYLKGITIEDAEEILFKSFQRRYRYDRGQFVISLDVARTVTINIVGEAVNPGSYTVPATYTVINALRLAGGPSDIGSLRDIELIKSDGERRKLDLYKFLQNPTLIYDFFLEQNDFIYIPTITKVVNLKGAVKRPFRYELLKGENLNKLVEYAGGLNANAYRSNIQIKRFENDRERIINVNLRKLAEDNRDFVLYDNDEIIIKTIPKTYENFVYIDGAVELPSQYELVDSMRIADLANLAILDKEARTDATFVKRKRSDGTNQYLRIDLEEAVADPSSPFNILLQAEDSINIFLQSKYADFGTVKVTGAVRDGLTFPFDISENLTIEDAILLAGGLTPEANNYAYLYRKNRENFEDVDYIRLNIKEIIANPSSSQNIPLMPYDSIAVFANPTFTDEFSIRVQGLVRNAGTFKYDETLTLKDALTLAGGLQIGAAANQIDLFRLNIGEDATQTMVAQLEVNEDLEVVTGIEFPLEPFDLIVVRRKPDFELFETVIIEGEVKYPGPYALLDDNERILSLVERAGGITDEAFPEGATLLRSQDNVGYVLFELEEVLLNKDSRSNLILKEGDTLYIPKQQDLVGITGATRAPELYPERILANNGQLSVPYHDGKRAKFYINEYAVGVSENGKRSLITVEQPNGRISRTVDLGIAKIYPKVQRGAVINVGVKPPKEEDILEEEREPVEWGQVVKDTLAQVTTVISLILLIERLN